MKSAPGKGVEMRRLKRESGRANGKYLTGSPTFRRGSLCVKDPERDN